MTEIKEPIYYAKASIETMMRRFTASQLPPLGHFHYHQGVFLSGVYKIWKLCQEESYFQYITDWVNSCIDPDGMISICDPLQLDDIQPGILLFPLLEKTGDSRYRKALDTLISYICVYPKNAEGGFWHKGDFPNQMWLDGLYMGGPFCMEYGKTFHTPELFDLTAHQVLLMENKTKDSKTGLFFHAWDGNFQEDWGDPVTGRSPEFWGRSIGWVPVALLDDLDFLPEDHPQRSEFIRITCELLEAVCRYQSEDGRWYQVVDKGSLKDNWLENSCSCLFVAALCKAVRKGFLPESYLKQAQKGYEGIIRSLTWDGNDLLVGNVCIGTGVGDYKHYCERPTCTNDLHGVGAFLLMCAELQQV